MKITAKNHTELCNIIYGDNYDYDYINDNGMNIIIDNLIDTLKEVYDYMEECEHQFEHDVYFIGDAINLIEQFKHVEYTEPVEIEKEEPRICTECGKVMYEGYCIAGGMEYYCSDKCLHKNISAEEYDELYNDDNSETYYTDWYYLLEEEDEQNDR